MSVSASGWVLKKPTSQASRPWSGAQLQKRFIESSGLSVAYYAEETEKRPKGMKPRGTFDLRDVSMLRDSQDSTAPATALELVVKKHSFTLSFKSENVRDSFLRLWVNGVPITAVPRPMLEKFYDASLEGSLVASVDEKELTPRQKRLSMSEGSVPLAPEGSVATAKDGWLDLRRREGGAPPSFVPVFLHCAGYLLSWYKEKPLHGEKASPVRVVDLREVGMVDVGEGLIMRLQTGDGLFELRANSEADGTQWLTPLASAVPVSLPHHSNTAPLFAALTLTLSHAHALSPRTPSHTH